jgi:hypothetical protein
VLKVRVVVLDFADHSPEPTVPGAFKQSRNSAGGYALEHIELYRFRTSRLILLSRPFASDSLRQVYTRRSRQLADASRAD